jgi:capsular polysaccharide biosynthesis protein
MRNTLIALIVGVVVLIGGFFLLVSIGSNSEPQQEEVRVDVTDQLSR